MIATGWVPIWLALALIAAASPATADTSCYFGLGCTSEHDNLPEDCSGPGSRGTTITLFPSDHAATPVQFRGRDSCWDGERFQSIEVDAGVVVGVWGASMDFRWSNNTSTSSVSAAVNAWVAGMPVYKLVYWSGSDEDCSLSASPVGCPVHAPPPRVPAAEWGHLLP